MQKGTTMHYLKHSCENVSYDKIEPFPMRALFAQEQKLLDATVTIKGLSLDEDLGYFVTKCIHGNPCANDVHGLHYQTNV